MDGEGWNTVLNFNPAGALTDAITIQYIALPSRLEDSICRYQYHESYHHIRRREMGYVYDIAILPVTLVLPAGQLVLIIMQ